MFVVKNAKPSWCKQAFRVRVNSFHEVQVQLGNSYMTITSKSCQDLKFLDLKCYSHKNPTLIDVFYDTCCLNRGHSCV